MERFLQHNKQDNSVFQTVVCQTSRIYPFQFDPTEYLESFYKSAAEDTAMNIVLFFLPGILYRLPEKIRTVLDLGAGEYKSS